MQNTIIAASNSLRLNQLKFRGIKRKGPIRVKICRKRAEELIVLIQ